MPASSTSPAPPARIIFPSAAEFDDSRHFSHKRGLLIRAADGNPRTLEIELWTAIDRRLRTELGLPLSSFEPIQVIARRGACRVPDIADEMAIAVGGTSKLVDRLESAGHCRRRSNPDDRRSSLIELTSAGRQLLAKVGEFVDEELEMRVGAVLSARPRQQFVMTLSTLREAGHRLDATIETEV